ncbi:MAG: hypothetical protein ACLFTY_01695 [Candidatus Aenigmatarchaeota archaeon]
MTEYKLRLAVSLEILERITPYRDRGFSGNIQTKEEFMKNCRIPDQSVIIDNFRRQAAASDSEKKSKNYREMIEQVQEIDNEDWVDVVYSIANGDYEL